MRTAFKIIGALNYCPQEAEAGTPDFVFRVLSQFLSPGLCLQMFVLIAFEAIPENLTRSLAGHVGLPDTWSCFAIFKSFSSSDFPLAPIEQLLIAAADMPTFLLAHFSQSVLL